ncbi:hypothetical protein [Mitsuaria sp. 7]|uniref:hypothetical protein n=1 Tax=Mitsuaria sp. 7 TaxID=1658665 RepID=UPI0007DD4B62|nr:hypothetical protein [Mitsuaria sp. 7]ANH66645.1 hypothetical protein ABE85_02040 [Mitsuaria sp. 7]
MPVGISSLAYAVRKASETTSHPLRHGHASQLVAALGYNTLAAHQAAVAEGAESEHLDAAAHAVLDEALLADRALELALPHSVVALVDLVRGAFKAELPGMALHRHDDALADVLCDLVDDRAYNHGQTSSAMDATNNDGVAEIYLPLDLTLAELPPPGEVFELEIEGHIAMSPDIERPYSGHKIAVRCSLFIERVSRVAITEPEFRLETAQLDYNWDGDSEDEPAKVPLAEALAEELGISQEEAEELVDVEPIAIEGHDDMVYGYVFDFADVASPQLQVKLLEKHGSLQHEVPLWFFERVAAEL